MPRAEHALPFVTSVYRETTPRPPGLDFGAGTRLTVFVTQPRGDVPADDPPSFTVQAYDEAGDPDGAPQPIWTANHALELAASDLTSLNFSSLTFDFGTVVRVEVCCPLQ